MSRKVVNNPVAESSMPRNFTWVIEGHLSASGLPDTPATLDWMREQGIDVVIHLCEEAPPDPKMYSKAGLELYYFPVRDYHPPSLIQAIAIVSQIDQALIAGKQVHVCCRSGIGRTPTVLSMYFVSRGMSPERAMNLVAAHRNGWAYGTGLQRNAIYALSAQLSLRQASDKPLS
ncbi:MAG: dual specificity protein phosphatase family protein [Chloroflexi bacterium]|nr:dual specificity protein phosphatase family protein [Chloroflexota bacterium]